MRYRLAVELPLEIDLGAGNYILELVSAGAAGGCWLRARASDEPIVFLLAHFRTSGDARFALRHGFEIGDRAFPVQLLQQLTEAGFAETLQRPVRPALPVRHPAPTEAAEVAGGYQLASV